MNRLQFIIVTSLSGVIALSLFLQVIFARISAADEIRLRNTESKLQDGQLCLTHWQQIAQRTAQLSQQQNDQALKDVLTRQGLTLKINTNSAPAAPGAAAPAPSTH